MIFDALGSVVGAATGLFGLFNRGGRDVVINAPAPPPPAAVVQLPTSRFRPNPFYTFANAPNVRVDLGSPWQSGFVPDEPPVRFEAAREPFQLERQLTSGTALSGLPPKLPRGDLPAGPACMPCVPACQPAPGRKRPSRRSDVERLQDALNRARRQLARANRCPPVTIVLPGGTRRRITR